MQNIPHNDWDNLFKNKFDNAEIEPSAIIWENIVAELPSRKKRKSPNYWWAVASIILVCTTLLVFDKMKKTALKSIVQTSKLTSHNKILKLSPKIDNDYATKPTSQKHIEGDFKISKKLRSPNDITYKNGNSSAINNNLKADEELFQRDQQIGNQPKKQPINTVVDTIFIATASSKESELNTLPIDSVSLNINEIAHKMPIKKGVRNVGELVNFLVSKIDKRPKKLLKFNTDVGGNSSITAINIGFIQLNSKKSYNN